MTQPPAVPERRGVCLCLRNNAADRPSSTVATVWSAAVTIDGSTARVDHRGSDSENGPSVRFGSVRASGSVDWNELVHTEGGLRVLAVTAQQMREVDRVAVEEIGPNLHQMMENAGRSLASVCMTMLGERWAGRPVVVVAGTGGNGGGGICAARHLANHGADVTVVVSDSRRLTGVPAQQLAAYRATNGRIADPRDLSSLQPALTVDALLGYSLEGRTARRGRRPGRVDVEQNGPGGGTRRSSGMGASTGHAPGSHIRATTHGDARTSQDRPPRRRCRRALGGRHRHPAGRLRTNGGRVPTSRTLFTGIHRACDTHRKDAPHE